LAGLANKLWLFISFGAVGTLVFFYSQIT
jgi:hypothetical protein